MAQAQHGGAALGHATHHRMGDGALAAGLRPAAVGDIRTTMTSRFRRRAWLRMGWLGLWGLLLTAGCDAPGERVRLANDNQQLRAQNTRLTREVAQRDGTILQLNRQLTSLRQLGPERPIAVFAPVKLKIASLSRGHDYDGKPGDDGVRVYLQPIDADGDPVKSPGKISVQLLDDSELGKPRLLGVYVFDRVEELRQMWHGKFLTQHFTVDCPFPPGTKLPASRQVSVTAEFVDYLSGATLTAHQSVPVSFPVETRPSQP